MNERIKYFLKVPIKLIPQISIFVAILAFFYVGYVFGTKHPEKIEVVGIKNMSSNEVKADMGIFWEAYQRLKANHYDTDKATEKDYVYSAISGLAGTFGDPNTVFFKPADSKDFKENISGSFGGIGAEIGIKNDQLVVVAPIKGSPSDKAGILSGDKIFKIEKKLTIGLTVPEAVQLIRGPIGTTVNLSMYREGWVGPKEFNIVRDEILLPNMDWKMLDSGIMYMHLYNFNDKVLSQFDKASSDFLKNNGKGIILDLRGNPGGYLQVAIALAGSFLKRDELVVTEDFKSAMDLGFHAEGNELFSKVPIVVLIDQGSASASEILAGALKFDRKIKIVGTKSFGKGTVQDVEDLSDGSSLKVTIAHWIMPDGSSIEKNGIAPDIEVQLTEDDVKNKKDVQLDKALETIKIEMGLIKKPASK